MSRLFVCLLIIMFQGPIPPPGNPDHVEPAPGQYCSHDGDPGIDPAHACKCERMCKPVIPDEGQPPTNYYVEEDPMCRSYCFKQHCHCPIHGCE